VRAGTTFLSFFLRLCALLCFVKLILGNRHGLWVFSEADQGARAHEMDRKRATSPQINLTWISLVPPRTLGGQILTLHLDYVLAIPIPSSASSNGPTTTPLTTRGFCPGGSVVWAGPKSVRPHWLGPWVMVKFLGYWSPKGLKDPPPPTTKIDQHLLFILGLGWVGLVWVFCKKKHIASLDSSENIFWQV